ncbi:MAG: cell surface protein SprA [Porphyromonadaceae bacterium CG2_30_38_12]|nr:MAG: cell surface protein SprA [Porphyromonadaceae bacterium CG2_30_38_12]
MKRYFNFLILTFLLVSTAYAFISYAPALTPSTNLESETDSLPADTAHKAFPIKKYTLQTVEDLKAVYPMDNKLPNNIKTEIEFDEKSGNYVFRTKTGDMEISTPFTMSSEEYQSYSYQKEQLDYWKEKNSLADVNNEDKFSVSDMKFNIGPADKVFGPGGVQVKTQGSAELIFGIKHNRVENPALTEEMRSILTPEFDMKIQMNVNGSVGDKVNFGMNYNTESSFDFDQKMVKLAYKGKEDDIVKNIQAGNVSMPLSSSLISGSTALFGIKTDLQFGKLSVSAIASQQQSESKTVSSKGGVQKTQFEVKVDDYDENRHFFLSHFFRDNYESAMSNLPYISSGVTLNRVEVWITNKRANYDQARNIIAFMDLGETEKIDNKHWTSLVTTTNPQNNANSLYDAMKTLTNVRDVQQANAVISDAFGQYGVIGGEDFEKIESARKLEPSEYTLNNALGIISLKSQLNPDDVLGVAFEYTYKGKVYQVGEFSTDAVTAPDALMVKLLKSTAQLPQRALWKLMMKNVYSLGAMQLEKDNFELNIVYRNDSIGTDMQYITEGKIKNKLLLRVMNLDRLDMRNNIRSDGKFDYVEGLTAISSTGRIFFPVLEPFGTHLRKMIDDPAVADNYVFQELYDSTLVVAQELSERNKFRIVGEYKASGGSEIRLNAMNVPRGSVTVTASGATLVENVDYTVDYTMGTVSILNQSLLESGTNIDVKLENQSTFNMQRKSLVGSHLEYQFSKDFSLGGTIMHLTEQPLTQKVNTGNEPISNTIWGMNTSWRGESQWLTNMLDKLPFVNATKPSSIALNAEFAQLVPGHSKIVGSKGEAYIDDFESTKTSIDIHYPVNWFLSSTPQLFAEATSNTVDYGKNRALMAWYYVDQNLNSKNPTTTTPRNLRNNVTSQSNHYTRDVQVKEVFPNKDLIITDRNFLTVMNLSYYPTERGPYNLDTENIDTNGNLLNPSKRWGGIMRKLDATDFETSNVEYIEFWMMDPFIYDKNDPKAGGELYLNLGDVSEDVLKDGKKAFEHGLPIDGDLTKTESTIWGKVPKTQSTVTAFDNTPGARKIQDVGLDGLSSTDEFLFPTYLDYVSAYKAKLNPEALQKLADDKFSALNDPAGDNYKFYKSSDYDNVEADILTRYKRFNGMDGNSPDANDSQEKYTTTATSTPNVEDVNGDNTLNEYEKYFQYKVAIKRDSMQVGRNYIADSYTSTVNLANGTSEDVTWYQFKIPIREYKDKIGSIRNFKSIRFVRLFMTDFEKETHLRFATLELVRGEWRKYSKELNLPGKMPTTNGALDVQAVNIEENSDKTPVNYVLPPGVTRVIDPGQAQIAQLNEQAMVLKVLNLAPNDARGVYKKTTYDMRQYKRLQMFIHAERLKDDRTNLKHYDVSCFIRLGSDMTNNYYEYEIPLKLSDAGVYSNESQTDRAKVWLPENTFDFSFDVLTKAKLERNKSKQNGSYISDYIPFYDQGKNKIRVVGNPSIAEVENIMIGVRNNATNGEVKTAEIWVNELRMSEFDEGGGWAAMGNIALGLSDLGSINFSGRTESAGYGSIESNVLDRRQEDLYQMNFSSTLDIGRFLPEKAKIQLPAYFSYTNETLTPKYNPLDQDIVLADALDNLRSKAQRDTLIAVSQTVNESKSFNITGAKINLRSKKPQFYDPANLAFTYSLTETNQHSAEVASNLVKQERGGINYSFSFTPQPVEPFKKIKALNKPAFKLITDFNFNYLPSAISYNTDMNRQFSQVKLRDLTGLSAQNFDLNFSKDFMWNRNFSINYDMTKALKFSLQTATNANIAESYYTPEIGKEYYERWRDTVWTNIKKLGTPYAYQQTFTASWAVPINKLPLLEWVTANATYNSTYSWNRSAPISASAGKTSEIGNIATSMGSWSGDGQLNFEKLYNKSKYLKSVNQRFGNQSAPAKFQPKTYTETIQIEKGKKDTINHRLNAEKLSTFFKDKKGKPIQLEVRKINASMLEVLSKTTADSVSVIVTTLDPNDLPFSRKIVDAGVRLLMMARRASITYRQTNNMTLPGFLPNPGFLGQEKGLNNVMAPGYAFTFGFFDNSTIDNAIANNWLYRSDSIVNPAVLANTTDLDIKASLEPIPGLKIDLNAKRYTANNTTIQYMFDGMPRTFNGSFNITQIAIATAFKTTGNATTNYDSEPFRKLLANRQIIADRLNGKLKNTIYPTTGFFSELPGIGGTNYDSSKGAYSPNASDVLIPAFLAAYTGVDPTKVNTNPFLAITSMLPNWRMSFDGLSRIQWVKDNFKSISLTHAYTARYSIGNYTSYSTWVAMGDGDNALGYVRDVQSNNPIPSSPYDIGSVSLTEQFSPLIGINAALKNSMTAKLEYRKQRNLALNLSSTQLIEANSDEFVVGVGYLLKDFDVIMKFKNNSQTKIKNDLKLSADLSYKDIKSLLRKIDENLTQASSGNKMFSLKVLADYVFSSKVNIQVFYDRQMTTPLISTTFPVSSTNFGINFKFMLTR